MAWLRAEKRQPEPKKEGGVLNSGMQEPRFLKNNEGQVEVILDVATYERLLRSQSPDPKLLRDLTREQLEALAKSTLTTSEESSLHALIEKKKTRGLTPEETLQLGELLEQVDQLALVKARALYTLHTMQPQTAQL
jgi:hypothetical protein